MIHMITDNIDAYRMAVAATATAQSIVRLNPLGKNLDELVNCQADEQVKLDGLMNVIGIAIRQAAAAQPHNPFSINGDVNQDAAIAIATTSPLEYAVRTDPDIRTTTEQPEHTEHGPPPREDE
tara:strand:+ start:518 stop:886 length:369 start_codon:yes stop_codon:yes gene_type:complete